MGSRELVQFVTTVNVDSDRLFTPKRATVKQGKLGLTFTDHFPIIVELQMPCAEPAEKLPLGWNLNKPGGWERYHDEAERIAEKIEMLSNDKDLSSEEVMEKVEKIQNKIKFTSFGKTKPKTKKSIADGMKADSTDEREAKELLKRQSDKMEAEILKIKASKHGRTTNVFKMREVVAGNKKSKQEAHAIMDVEKSNLEVLPERPGKQCS